MGERWLFEAVNHVSVLKLGLPRFVSGATSGSESLSASLEIALALPPLRFIGVLSTWMARAGRSFMIVRRCSGE